MTLAEKLLRGGGSVATLRSRIGLLNVCVARSLKLNWLRKTRPPSKAAASRSASAVSSADGPVPADLESVPTETPSAEKSYDVPALRFSDLLQSVHDIVMLIR